MGSNNWVVAPSRSASGSALLANGTVPLPFTDPGVEAAEAALLVLQPAP